MTLRPSKRAAARRRKKIAALGNVRDLVYARDGWRCIICFSGTGLVAHHKLQRSLGGRDTLENLITVCDGPGGCHQRIHTDIAWAHAHGYLLHSWEVA